MLYELRVYHCVPGRLPDLIKRFDTLTLPLWQKHGIQQAGFWTVAIGPSNQGVAALLAETLSPFSPETGIATQSSMPMLVAKAR